MAAKIFDVAVVGAGPAGLFACYELLEHGLDDLVLVDRGKRAGERSPRDDVLFGVGGAGLWSDGKLNFAPVRGKTDLTEFLPLAEAQGLIDYLEATFARFGMDGDTYPSDMEAARRLKEAATRLGMMLMLVRQKHLGSDRLPGYIARLEGYLEQQGATLQLQTRVERVERAGGLIRLVADGGQAFVARHVILAPGRSANQWLADQLAALGSTLEYQPIEVGVRVEVPAEVLEATTHILYDPPIFFFSHSYDDQLRTFCTNPNGFVTREPYKQFICVNGHAYKDQHSPNSNFALLNRIGLSEPITNTIAYGESIAILANTIGAGRPVLQRLVDFRRFRRSTWGRLAKSYIQPTLTEVTPGDIAMALPHRVVVNLTEGLERLDALIPGIGADSTLLYAPEVKFHSCRPKIDNYLETEVENVFVAGDGAGVSGNIVGAAATGVIAARRILERSKG